MPLSLSPENFDAVPSGSFALTFFIYRAQFISLLSQTVCTHANTILNGVNIFIVEG